MGLLPISRVKPRHDARCVWLERAVVLAVFVIVILIVFCFGSYALHKIKPGWLRIHGSVLRMITFSMEIGQPGEPGKPRDERRELGSADDR